jgi:hypothetical protein
VRSFVVSLAVVLTWSVGAAPASAQDACAPGLTVKRPHPVSVETITPITVSAAGASTVQVDWGDGAHTIEPVTQDGNALALHRFGRPGPRPVIVTATCPTGTSAAPVLLRLNVFPPCERRRGPSVAEADCDTARGELVLSDIGGQAPAGWVDSPCRDSGHVDQVQAPGDAPRARAADCLFVPGPLPGPLYTRAGASIRLALGAPARRIVVRAARGSRAPRRLGDAHATSRSGLAWRLRLPRSLPRRVDRLQVIVLRAGEADEYVIGLRLEQPRRR